MPDAPHGAPPTHLRRSSRLIWLVALGVFAAAAGAGAWLLLRASPSPPAAPPAAVATAPAAPAPAPEVSAAAEPPAGADEAGALLAKASPNALFREALAAGELVQRWVVVTANLAAGESPRRALPFLAPRGAFSVQKEGGRLTISPASFSRYDALGDAVASVDAAAAVSAYRRLHGVLEAAYRALGSPGSLDAATVRALRRIANAPAPEGPITVAAAEGLFAFTDPRLETLPEVEKHLVRMGPRNERLVQAKARELLARLAPAAAPLPAAAPPAAPAAGR